MSTASLRAFMAASIDYAGLFPPAGLALEPALCNYATYLTSEDAWMLARFVCPSAQLAEAAPHIGLFTETQPLAVSALGRKSNSPDDFIVNLRLSLNEMAEFRAAHGACVSVEQLEAPLPSGLTQAATQEVLARAAELIECAGPPNVMPFWEVTLDSDWQQTLHDTARAMAAHNARGSQPVALKLRTGGTVASAFPTSAQIGTTLLVARDHGVIMKCTAGLHHPLRRYEASVQTKMHGFVNVLGAGILAWAGGLTLTEVQRVLEDEDPAHFHFAEDGFSWGDRQATLADIVNTRRALVSFGSCSFDEPRADLRALGWL